MVGCGDGVHLKWVYVLFDCADNLHIGMWISKAVAHLTAEMSHFVLSAMGVTDSTGKRQMIVTALQGGRNWHNNCGS